MPRSRRKALHRSRRSQFEVVWRSGYRACADYQSSAYLKLNQRFALLARSHCYVTDQRAHGFDVWQDPFVVLRFPKLFDLFQDPFEFADHEAIGYGRWRADRMFALAPAQAYVGEFLATFKDYPPRQKPGRFSIDQVLETLQAGGTDSN